MTQEAQMTQEPKADEVMKSSGSQTDENSSAPAGESGQGTENGEGIEVPGNPNLNWYAVMIQSNMEKRAKTVLEERIKKKKLEHLFGRIIIPTQLTEKFDDKGKKKKVETKMMPGYIFIEMEMTEPAYHLVKETPKVTNFLGASTHKAPPPLTNEEVDRVINRAAHVEKEKAVELKDVFEKGEKVKVIDGPFTNFMGDVDEVKADKQKLRLLISVFGRPTPVEIEYTKVQKVDPNAEES